MIRLRHLMLAAAMCSLASAAGAADDDGAGLISVAPFTTGACVQGPNGGGVQFWEVEPGKTYTLTISNVFDDCADDGEALTIGVRVNSSSVGNTDLVATRIGPGLYKFDFPIPPGAQCTMPIFYCTTPGMSNTGERVIRDDDDDFQAHLRMASFGPGCTNPIAINNGDCSTTPTRFRTWAQVKQFYR